MQDLNIRAHDGRVFPYFKISILKDASALFISFFLVTSFLSIALYTKCDEMDWLQSEFASTITKKEIDIQRLEGEQDRLIALKKGQEDKLQKLHEKVNDQSLELTRKESDIQRLEGEQDRLETLKNDQKDKLQELNKKQTEKEKDIQSLQNKLADARGQNRECKRHLDDNEIRFKEYDNKFENEQHQHTICKVSLKDSIEESEQLQKERETPSFGGIMPIVLLAGCGFVVIYFIQWRSYTRACRL